MYPLLVAACTLHLTSTTTRTPSATTIRARVSNTDPTTMPARDTGDSCSGGGDPDAEVLCAAVAISNIFSALLHKRKIMMYTICEVTGKADHESVELARRDKYILATVVHMQRELHCCIIEVAKLATKVAIYSQSTATQRMQAASQSQGLPSMGAVYTRARLLQVTLTQSGRKVE